ncbi:DUF3304 domain-containing protein [Enterobacter cloacae subsp. cloacae]|uniref:DUF3304 domain-containing protein n=1 Tax=Enterobacter TaxID=547 RepID=UPI00067D880F|nr:MULTISPECIES: DUF3304 domain-containing protein [Enterobacter]EMC0025365.1 DUF3304 domain-containing protein [Enterobacter cloacae]KTH96925.1 hypothetical protein ASV14_15770 [Enterobacter cloacae subsp. cloacae]KTI61646.1 hypothetical protein ASV00_23325 [Enterobacter cloacae subsp. cloacae]KVI51253.1 hypothetical protein AWS52_22340 [Enterobacter cloacae subsp. cloacae]MBN4761591.1 DUF3304 domain-containing protein [Enterobacter cloacae]
MGFFRTYKKIDGAVNRGYARWGRWIWGALLLPVVIYLGWSVWAAVWGSPSGPVTLIIHSEIDRPVLGFSVNGVAGSNAFAYGGGGSTCCGSITGDKAEVIWTLSTTRAQYDAGLRKETRRLTLPLPKREWGENYLHVYFLPDDNVYLWWSTGFNSPSAENIAAQAAEKQRQNMH